VETVWRFANRCEEPPPSDAVFSWDVRGRLLAAAWGCETCGGVHSRLYDLDYTT
jgi:hypothetical protein